MGKRREDGEEEGETDDDERQGSPRQIKRLVARVAALLVSARSALGGRQSALRRAWSGELPGPVGRGGAIQAELPTFPCRGTKERMR